MPLTDTACRNAKCPADRPRAREQTGGIAQSAKAVQEMDTVTRQNAALVEQTAAPRESLNDQAVGLAGEVAQFKLPASFLASRPRRWTHSGLRKGFTARHGARDDVLRIAVNLGLPAGWIDSGD